MDTSIPSDATTPQTKRAALLEIIDLVREHEQALAGLFDADARAAVGTVEAWAPKDHFVHLYVWQAYQARRLESTVTGATPTKPADNDTVFLEHRDEPWETIWAEAMRALDDNAAAVTQTSEEDLTDPDRFRGASGHSLLSLSINNIYLHPIAHLADMYEQRGDGASAEHVLRASVVTVARLFGKGEQYANAVYTLGCFYAKRGQSADAIAQVREALVVNSKLADAIKEDADLVSLRDLPEYQALFTA
jgi:tetratricopeptide (TPR) repeat protein